MLNLIRSDLFKLLKSKSFRVCMILCVALIAFLAFSQVYSANLFLGMSPEALRAAEDQVAANTPNIRFGLSNTGGEDFARVVEAMQDYNGYTFMQSAFSGNVTTILMAVFIAMFICAEFRDGTLRNTVSKGFNRRDIYLSKLITVMAGTLLLLAAAFVTTLVFSLVCWGPEGFEAGNISLLAYRLFMQALLHFGLASFFVMTAACIKHTGPTVALNICLLIFITTFLSLGNIVYPGDFNFISLWVADAMTSLSFDSINSLVILQVVLTLIAYTVLPTLIGTAIFRKQDIM